MSFLNRNSDAAEPREVVTFQDFEGIVIDGEFYIRDAELAKRLGYQRDRKIRDLIERNLEEIQSYGPLPRRGAMVDIGSGAKREVEEFYLNRDQALMITLIGRTEASKALRSDMIRMYNFWHTGGRRDHRLPDIEAENAAACFIEADMAFARCWSDRHFHRSEVLRLREEIELHERRAKDRDAEIGDRSLMLTRMRQRLDLRSRFLPGACLWARHLAAISVDACVLWTLREIPRSVSLPSLRDLVALRFGVELSIAKLRRSLERLESWDRISIEQDRPSAHTLGEDGLPPQALVMLELLNVMRKVPLPRDSEAGAGIVVSPALLAYELDRAPQSGPRVPGAVLLVDAIFESVAWGGIDFVDGRIWPSPDDHPYVSERIPNLSGDKHLAAGSILKSDWGTFGIDEAVAIAVEQASKPLSRSQLIASATGSWVWK